MQVDYNVVHLRTSLVQLFVLLLQNFEKVLQMIELKRFGGVPNGYPFAALACFLQNGQPFKDFTNTRSRCPLGNNKRKLDSVAGKCCFKFIPHFLIHD
jgi:hypothetical protein